MTEDGETVEKNDMLYRWTSHQDMTFGGETMQVVTRPQAINVNALDVE